MFYFVITVPVIILPVYFVVCHRNGLANHCADIDIDIAAFVTTIISAPIIHLSGKVIGVFLGEDPLIKPLHKLLLLQDKAEKNTIEETEETTDEVEEVFAETASSQPCDEK